MYNTSSDVLYESPGSHDMSYISNDGSLSYHGSLEDMLYDDGHEADDVMKPIAVPELFDYVDRKRSDTAAFLSEFMVCNLLRHGCYFYHF